MPQAFGHNAWIGFAPEATYGTAVAPTKFLEIESENFKGEQTWLSRPALRSASPKNVVKSKKSVSGGCRIQMPWEGAEVLLLHALGAVQTTGAGPYTHTFSLANNLPVGLTFHVNRDADNLGGNSAFQYEGCQVQRLVFRGEPEDFMKLELEVMGEDWSNLAKATPTFPTFDGVHWIQLTTANLDDNASGVGPTALKMRSFELTIENSLAEDRYVLGSDLRTGLGRSAQRRIHGRAEIEFTDINAYAYYSSLALEDLKFVWTNGTKSLTFNLPKVAIDGEDPSADTPGPLVMPLAFSAYADAADNDELEIVLINNTVTVP